MDSKESMPKDKMTYNSKSPPLIPPHGGYQDLQSYKMAEIRG
jgi:hypothetical protein